MKTPKISKKPPVAANYRTLDEVMSEIKEIFPDKSSKVLGFVITACPGSSLATMRFAWGATKLRRFKKTQTFNHSPNGTKHREDSASAV